MLKKIKPKTIFIILAILIIFILINRFSSRIDPEKIKSFLLSFGIFTPVIFMLLNAAAVTFSFLAAPPLWIAGMWIFGKELGFLYIYFSNLFGQTINFFLARKYGSPLITKLAGKKTMTKIDELMGVLNYQNFVILRLIGGIPTDYLSYASGLASIKVKQFFIITAFTSFYNCLIIYLAMYSILYYKNPWEPIIFGTVIAIQSIFSILTPIYLYKKSKPKL